jgi:hypothetical protein
VAAAFSRVAVAHEMPERTPNRGQGGTSRAVAARTRNRYESDDRGGGR